MNDSTRTILDGLGPRTPTVVVPVSPLRGNYHTHPSQQVVAPPNHYYLPAHVSLPPPPAHYHFPVLDRRHEHRHSDCREPYHNHNHNHGHSYPR
jgi:hypothetical protein